MYCPTVRFDTNVDYSPWSLLPAPDPSTVNPPSDYFYHNVAKHLVRDTVRIMSNGVPIDLQRVSELEARLDIILADVQLKIDSNPITIDFLSSRTVQLRQAYIENQRSKFKPASHFRKPFKHTDMVHRSYFMHLFAQSQNIEPPAELLPTGIPKWPANLVKRLSASRPVLQRLLSGELTEDHPLVSKALDLLSQHKADLHNRQYEEKIAAPNINAPPFNLSSPPQKQALLGSLGYISDKISKKTNQPSWDRKQVERILSLEDEPNRCEILQCFVDHSFAAIVRRNFIESFYRYTVDGRLFGNYRILGAKTGRYTSKLPNMLNMPSTNSIFAKPVKRCLIAPPGRLIYAIDLAALEDRVMACLSNDTNKLALFTDGLDGHCLNSYEYYKEEVLKYLTPSSDRISQIKQYFELQDSGHEKLKAIRQKSKNVTFKLNYGGFPDSHKGGIITKELFDRYHNALYPGITTFRERYVLPTALSTGQLHLGLGFYIKSDTPERDIRTLANATCQFWSIITAITINRMHQLIDAQGLNSQIKCISTIYDSIYFDIPADPTIIHWLNSNIVPTITRDFIENQRIPNAAAGEIGLDWASLKGVPINATIEQISTIMEALYEH